MTKDEWKSLTVSLAGAWSADIPRDAATGSAATLSGSVQSNSTTFETEVESLVRSAAALQAAAKEQQAANQKPPRQSSSSSASSSSGGGSSIAGDVLKTAGMVTGVGPIVTGLIKLFGGGGQEAPPPALTAYEMPERLSVEAGLLKNGSLTQVSYAQTGVARALPSSRTEEGGSGPSPQATSANAVPSPGAGAHIQIQVNAMDSRSFMDHSDDIARAVRAAMLRSNSVNDVIAEI